MRSIHLPLMLAMLVAAAAVPSTMAEEKQCESHGTSVEFVASPAEAAKYAKREEKLVMVLHVSGVFEDSGLT